MPSKPASQSLPIYKDARLYPPNRILNSSSGVYTRDVLRQCWAEPYEVEEQLTNTS